MGTITISVSCCCTINWKSRAFYGTFTDRPQYINNTVIDDFLNENLDLRWTFIRHRRKTYSLLENPGFLRFIQNLIKLKTEKG